MARRRPAAPAASRAEPLGPPPRRYPAGLVTVSLVTSGCGLLYALYRAYYGLGGTFGMIGRPASEAPWRAINLAAAVVLLVLALLPVAALPSWRRPRLRRILLALCWALAVVLATHALVQDTQRVLSLVGALHIRYPVSFWLTLDRHAADVQDLAFNETWFLAQGLLWGTLALIVLGRSSARHWWAGTALAAIAALTSIGILTAFGATGRFIVF